ncbi:MAG: 23S rRNA pseudouridine(1911/1915/1917) synthase RluD [Gammaproteobacteria bacterium]
MTAGNQGNREQTLPGTGITGEPLRTVLGDELKGLRLDQALAQRFPAYSRTTLKRWILDGKVRVDRKPPRPRNPVRGGEQVEVWAQAEICGEWQPQSIVLDVLYEDEDLIVLNKPAGLVVHPGAGNRDGTLLNALLHFEPALATLPRAGIVHRLDKDTSGIMVVARSPRAQTKLVQELCSRSLKREYQAVINGLAIAGGTVNAPIGRHPTLRTRMAITERGKPACTHYRVIKRFRAHSHLRVRLDTGRTHQIRVHMAHLGYPLLGDPLYGGRLRLPPSATPDLAACLKGFKRQALHAARLELRHPGTDELLAWSAPLPPDFSALLAALAADLAEKR